MLLFWFYSQRVIMIVSVYVSVYSSHNPNTAIVISPQDIYMSSVTHTHFSVCVYKLFRPFHLGADPKTNKMLDTNLSFPTPLQHETYSQRPTLPKQKGRTVTRRVTTMGIKWSIWVDTDSLSFSLYLYQQDPCAISSSDKYICACWSSNGKQRGSCFRDHHSLFLSHPPPPWCKFLWFLEPILHFFLSLLALWFF